MNTIIMGLNNLDKSWIIG